MRAAGGQIYAVTSEPQALATRAEEAWRMGFESIGDPHHEITATMAERGWLELFVNERLGFLERSSKGSGFQPQHPKGYFQPGVLALTSEGRVLYRWRSIPSRQNTGGATGRPTAAHVWSSIERALEAKASGAGEAADVAHDDAPPLDTRPTFWPLFVSLLVANGWFIRPKGFPETSGGAFPRRRIRIAGLRLVAFLAAWAAAFTLLPILWVATALAAWLLWITPKIRWLHREFQSQPAPT